MNFIKTLALSATMALSFDAFAASVVVVHPSNQDVVTADLVKSVFLGKNKELKPVVVSADDAAYLDFSANTLGKTQTQLKSYWAQRIFTGKGKPPAEKGSEKDTVAFVAANPKAIAIVDESAVDGSVKVALKP